MTADWRLSAAGTAHGQAGDPQAWLPDADRNTLSAFATHADTGIHLEIITDHGDLGEGGRTVADQGCALDRGDDLAVLDPIGLGALEDELAGRDIDLSAAEITA